MLCFEDVDGKHFESLEDLVLPAWLILLKLVDPDWLSHELGVVDFQNLAIYLTENRKTIHRVLHFLS